MNKKIDMKVLDAVLFLLEYKGEFEHFNTNDTLNEIVDKLIKEKLIYLAEIEEIGSLQRCVYRIK